MIETLAHGYSSESYPMNTNQEGLDSFKKSLHPCALDENSLEGLTQDYIIFR